MSGESKQPSRRGFFCESSMLLASTLPTHGTTPAKLADQLRSVESTPIRVGVLGCSRRSIKLAETAINKYNAHLVSVFDPQRARVQQFTRTIKGRCSSAAPQQVLSGESRRIATGFEKCLEPFLRSTYDLVIVSPSSPQVVWNDVLPSLAKQGTAIYLDQPIASDLSSVPNSLLAQCDEDSVICVGTPTTQDDRYEQVIGRIKSTNLGIPSSYEVSVRLPCSNPSKNSRRPNEELRAKEDSIPTWQQDWLVEVASAAKLSALAFRSPITSCRVSHVQYGENAFQSQIRLGFENQCEATVGLRRADQPGPYQRQAKLLSERGECNMANGVVTDLQGRAVDRIELAATHKFPEFERLLRYLAEPVAALRAPMSWESNFKLAMAASGVAHESLQQALSGN